MSESGRGLQIVNVTKSHSYELDEAELAQLLLRDDVKDLPVVVVSVAGAYRGGKSFLLNFFIRYLYSPVSEQQDGSWLGEDSKPLVGFKWRSGATATTMGVLMWSEPFITTLSSGEKVAVLLVDTQGNFDSKSTVRDNSTIFALSTLVSSIQIYNISQNIQEDHLQHLELFSEYGKLVNTNKAGGNQKAFQVLEFLVRDWQFPSDNLPYGAIGGEHLLREKFEITEDLPKEMKNLRQHIMSSFETVSCFLMPHPGFDVLESTYRGDISEIRPVFRKQLIQLVNSIFSPAKLLPKKINGERVKARELFNFFKTYMELFNSDEIPNPTNILAATVKAGLLSAVSEAHDVYENSMNAVVGVQQPAISGADLKDIHQKNVEEAKNFFIKKKKMGTVNEADSYLKKLTKELDDRLPQFVQSNLSKIQAAINQARDAYQKAIEDISRDKPLCVHPKDLEKIHKTALDAAIKMYDDLVRRVSAKVDDDRAKFIPSFKNQFTLLRRENEKNNKMTVKIIMMEYYQRMQSKALQEPPLSDVEFKSEHKKELEQTLKDFDSKRSMPNQYSEDVYKYQVAEDCQESFVTLTAMNKSKNKIAMNAGLEEYDTYMKKFANNENQCLHPDDLEETHRTAVCRTLAIFRPQKECDVKNDQQFDKDDEDEQTLKKMLDQRYSKYKTNNEASNETAVVLAFNTYTNNMEDKCRFSGWWVLLVPYLNNLKKRNEFHGDSKILANEKFYAQRKVGVFHPFDTFKARLDEMIEECYVDNYKSLGEKFRDYLFSHISAKNNN